MTTPACTILQICRETRQGIHIFCVASSLGLIDTGRARVTPAMGPVLVNGSVDTAHKQHQRRNVPICVRVTSRVLCELGLM